MSCAPQTDWSPGKTPTAVGRCSSASWVLATPAGVSLVAADAAQVIIETIKGSEDGCGDVIVRLYESMRQRGPVTLRTAFPLAAAWRTNLLEENQAPLPHQDHAVSFTLRPYEIVTLRLRPA